MKKFYDEFTKLPITKMSEKMSELTYLYKSTEVPAIHYKKQLEVAMLEVLAQDSTITLAFLDTMINQIKALRKENEELFVMAMLCIDNKLKVDSITERELDSLFDTFKTCNSNKMTSKLINQDIHETYKNYHEQHPMKTKVYYGVDFENEY